MIKKKKENIQELETEGNFLDMIKNICKNPQIA
jgi:hypothetical protein